MGFLFLNNFPTLHIFISSYFAILGHVNDSCAAPVVKMSLSIICATYIVQHFKQQLLCLVDVIECAVQIYTRPYQK